MVKGIKSMGIINFINNFRYLFRYNLKKLLGKRIQELRKKKNITQQQLADMLEIDQRTLSAIECGINFPSKNLIKIAEVFGVEIKDIFDFEHNEMSREMFKKAIIGSLDKLDTQDLKTIYRLTKSMI